MKVSKRIVVAGLAAVPTGLVLGGERLAFAQSQGDVIGELASNEGIFVDGKTFKIARGKAKGDPSAQIARLGAKEVGPGAIIFRYRDVAPNFYPAAIRVWRVLPCWAVMAAGRGAEPSG